MAKTHFKGAPVETNGALPAVGSKLPGFNLVRADLSTATLADYAGKKLVLNIFPSVDTGICAMSVRAFNAKAADLAVQAGGERGLIAGDLFIPLRRLVNP